MLRFGSKLKSAREKVPSVRPDLSMTGMCGVIPFSSTSQARLAAESLIETLLHSYIQHLAKSDQSVSSSPGSFTPPGRVMLQSLSPRVAASHKVAGRTSKVGKRVVVIVDPPKGSATIGFILAQSFGGFGAGPMELPRCEFRQGTATSP